VAWVEVAVAAMVVVDARTHFERRWASMRLLRAIARFAGAGALVAALLGKPSVAFAQAAGTGTAVPGKEVAKRLFEDGVDLEKKSDFAGALAKYKEAEQITVTPGLRFHKGYCLEQTGKLAAALEEYEAADKLATASNKQDVHAAVVVRLEPLRSRVPQIAIRLTTPVKDVDVQLDGVAVGPQLLDGKAFRLDPGAHVVMARAPAYKTFSRTVQVPESVTTTVDVSLDRAPTGAVVPPAAAVTSEPARPGIEPPAEARRSRSLALPITTTAATVALAGTGVAMFLVAGGAQSDAQTACPAKTSCDDERSRVRTFDAVALGAFIGAAGFAVVSVVLWTSSGSERTASAPVPPVTRGRLVAAPNGVGIAGTFW